MNIKRCIISPPFGNYFTHEHATSVKGTLTVKKRRGLIWNTLKTFRRVPGGWINKIGFRNPGISNIKFKTQYMYSISALEEGDWMHLYDTIPHHVKMVELNIGCPNVAPSPLLSRAMLDLYHMIFDVVSVKIPPTHTGIVLAFDLIEEIGATLIHCANTIPTQKGGISGTQLKKKSLPNVEILKKRYGDSIKIIGGGGIYTKQDVGEYLDAGADHLSFSTAFMKPWHAKKLITYANAA